MRTGTCRSATIAFTSAPSAECACGSPVPIARSGGAGLDFVVPHKLAYGDNPVRLRNDWHVGVGVERIADLTCISLTVGISSPGRYDADFESW